MKKSETLLIVKEEPWLEAYAQDIEDRYLRYQIALKEIELQFGSILEFASAHQYYGFHYDSFRKGWIYREWAPKAYQLFLMGDFNYWNRGSHPMKKNHHGDWEIFLPFEEYKLSFVHESKVKVLVIGENGSLDRIPAYIRRVVQDTENHDFSGQLWFPPQPFKWTDSGFSPVENIKQPLIYECHPGMAQEKEGVGTYLEFADNILPRIKEGGYNTIQMMAIMEHPYYGSFGYHVSNFFCPTSRFGTPEELKYLLNKAHEMGISVIMDIVHSHAVKNVNEGLNEFDGSDHHYFHPGGKGYHEGWDSKLFDYGKSKVQQFLLSNIRYWMEEFHFDGFRFDGATSILYLHHGNTDFDNPEKYFRDGVDWDAVLYMQLANTVIHKFKQNCLSIAEEVSGMPGLCRPLEEGGLGFDFRLAMGIPDFWIKTLKHKTDEEWDLFEMWHELTNRPKKEKSIAYAESHDQALVGDKSIAFWLMDKEMYFHMGVEDPNLVIDRGIALHKLIRLFTISLGGEGYLNFMGNEFGHPEWVDFPREGNDWSYQYARRQWSLVENANLKYQFLGNWDKAMVSLIKDFNVLPSAPANQLYMDPKNKIIVFERGGLIFIFSFNISESFFGYAFKVPHSGNYRIVLNSDDKKYGGFERINAALDYPTDEELTLRIYVPNRTALVLKKL
ncbi:1,4-alpha-glucan branching protein [Rhodonellum psychrophilum GCM71 = DSM 17998]|uniref:1,4-alpha-glucan branching enzyme n=2 Tax=Rhodonellum TaxID=336827 RepID=U5BK90_9BACT|nr:MULTISPECIES: alpha amylase C-terminal domain-containing protein [Rhodonellum]ERM80850.1 1,4-alpha-glucan branching protein [Rhodonellum psychrophilum GCM71 = DSM 17998]SDZ52580.1 1,4-alpha-glucan branching enzyme [Rhodonellum ikkaensis]